MMTVGLLAVVVYLYTVVAFNFFRKFYNKSEDEDEPDMKCDDMMTVSHCWFRNVHFYTRLSTPLPKWCVFSFPLSVTCSTCTWACVLVEASETRSRILLEMNTSSIEWSLILHSSSSSSSFYWPLFRVNEVAAWKTLFKIYLLETVDVGRCRQVIRHSRHWLAINLMYLVLIAKNILSNVIHPSLNLFLAKWAKLFCMKVQITGVRNHST